MDGAPDHRNSQDRRHPLGPGDLEDESELGGQATTGTVSVGGSVTGTLDVDVAVDWFRVTLEAGKTYRIKVRGADSSGGTLSDPHLRLTQAFETFFMGVPVGNDDKDMTTKDSELTFTVRAAEGGDYFVEVATVGTDTGTYTVEVEEVTTSSQLQAANTPAEGEPRINGTASVEQTLSVDTTGITDADGLEGATFSYQWLADEAEIDGATGPTYTVVSGDESKAIRVRVTFTDDAGNEESLTSAATAEVAAAGLQLRSATLDGATLTLTYNETLDEGGSIPSGAFTVTVAGSAREVTGVSVSGSSVTLTLASEAGAGDAVTVDYTRPEGQYFIRDIRGRVAPSFSRRVVTNDTAAEEQSTSRSQAPGSPRNLAVVRHESGRLRASWDAPDSGTTPTGYTVQWKESGDDWAEQADVSEAQVTGTSHVITGLTDGVEYAVRIITSTDDADSAPSGEAAATPQETVPPAPSGATVDGTTLTITFS